LFTDFIFFSPIFWHSWQNQLFHSSYYNPNASFCSFYTYSASFNSSSFGRLSGELNLYTYLHLFLEKALLEENTSKSEGESLKDKEHYSMYCKLKHSSNMFLFKPLHLRKQTEEKFWVESKIQKHQP